MGYNKTTHIYMHFPSLNKQKLLETFFKGNSPPHEMN